MKPEALKIAIVIPAYNETHRLPRTLDTLSQMIKSGSIHFGEITEVIISDDGSTDDTAQLAQSYAEKFSSLKVLTGFSNQGKGAAVRRGVLAAQAPWTLVADADMATPWTEIDVLSKAVTASNSTIAIGSRDLKESQMEKHQSWARESLGKCFNFFVRILTGLPFRDTQCGFKLFKTADTQFIFASMDVENFAWDVDFLIRAQGNGLAVTEVPIRWMHQEESKVHLVRDGLDMVLTVLKIRVSRFFNRLTSSQSQR